MGWVGGWGLRWGVSGCVGTPGGVRGGYFWWGTPHQGSRGVPLWTLILGGFGVFDDFHRFHEVVVDEC